jgi:signal transduction histidine kinase
MERFLLLIAHENDRRLITQLLDPHFETLVSSQSEALHEQFDLAILDEPSATKFAREIQARKERERPLHLPFLLISQKHDLNIATAHLQGAMDDVLWIPTERAFFLARINTLLRSRRLSKEVVLQKEVVEALSREKDDLLRVASHDLKAPAATARMAAKMLLEEDLDDEERTKLAKSVLDASDRQLDLLKRILDMDRIEQGRIGIERHPCDPIALLRKSIDNHALDAEKKIIAVKLGAKAPTASCLLDPSQMEQVFDNLLSNAIKYSYPETTITVSVAQNGAHLEMSFSDEGLGIKPEDTERIFDKFVRISKPTGGEVSTGLGLAIAKKIVELHDGQIRVDSKVGQGSTFTVRLPLESLTQRQTFEIDQSRSCHQQDALRLFVKAESALQLESLQTAG